MPISRRSLIAGATASATGLLFPVSPARAIVPERYREPVRELMGMTWLGMRRTKSADYRGGEFRTAIMMRFQLNDDFSFKGALLELLTLGGREYYGHFRTYGEAWVIGSEVGMSIYRMEFLKGDPPPQPLTWSTSKADFRFYNDSSRPGRFTMQGVMTDDGDGTRFEAILNDKDPS